MTDEERQALKQNIVDSIQSLGVWRQEDVERGGVRAHLQCTKRELEFLLSLIVNNREWVPVSERLPKDEEDVLVYCGQCTVKIAYYHHDYTFYSIEFKDLNETGWYDENDDAMYPEPVAWQPLPEPYKAEIGEQNV